LEKYVPQMLDPNAKSLVFSTWTDVLDILASALVENDIPFAALQDQGKFKRNLEKFKVSKMFLLQHFQRFPGCPKMLFHLFVWQYSARLIFLRTNNR
jgi:hypothetical protein